MAPALDDASPASARTASAAPRGHEPSRPARTAYLIGPLPPPHSGHSISFAMLCEGFARRGLAHRVIDVSDGRERPDGGVSLTRLLSLIRPLLAGLRLVLRPRANVYLATSQSWPGFVKDLVFILCARIGGHRVILHRHGADYQSFYEAQPAWRRAVIRRTLALADRLVVLSAVLAEMYAFVPGYRKKVVVVQNGLPEELPEWAALAAKRAGGDGIRVLYLSNLIESKGYLDVLEAVRRLVRDHGLDVKADFCGEFWLISDSALYRSTAAAREDFQRRVEAAGLGERVVWHGHVAGARKRALLAGAHYLVLPTAYRYEGQPIAIIEAMAYGALVVSTAFRTIPEMLDDGRAGVLVAPRRPEQIVQAVLDHPVGSPAYQALVRAARDRCARMFTRERHLERLIAVIDGDPTVS